MLDLYKPMETGRGDYAVTFPGGVLQTGMNEVTALVLARGMNADVESVSMDELRAVSRVYSAALSVSA